MITFQQYLTGKHLLTVGARQWCLANWDYMVKPMPLFGSSIKVEKGAEKRDTKILYLQPAGKVSLRTICDGAVAAGCEGPCLISSGQLGMSTGQRAATKRTIILLLAPAVFEQSVLREIDKAEKRAEKTGIPALFRLNGTSDIDFSSIIRQRPRSDFYDYSKVLSRLRKNTLSNYHITFSGSMYSKQSKAALAKAVARNHTIAVAYNTKLIASDNITIPKHLADFDDSDLRPLDSAGTIGALKRKGSNKLERAAEGYKSFFVTAHNHVEFENIIAKG